MTMWQCHKRGRPVALRVCEEGDLIWRGKVREGFLEEVCHELYRN